MSRMTSHRGWWNVSRCTSTPAVNSSVSPGRKKPISSPHSAKTITMMPIRPKSVHDELGSSHDVPRAVTVTSAPPEATQRDLYAN